MTKPLPTLSVICPVYNEEEVIETFHASLSKVLNTLNDRYSWNILFVMDRSSDRSLDILRELAERDKRVQALALSRRFGHQMSLVAGIDHSDSDIIIMMDSDLQHPPELIPLMLEAYEEGNDLVYTIRKESRDQSALKRLASRSFYRVMNWFSNVSLASGEADFRLISRRISTVFREKIRERNQFLRGLFKWVGFRSKGIEYSPCERIAGSSKYNWSRMLTFASSGIVSFSKKPLQFSIIIGVIMAIIGLFSGLFSLINFFISHNTPSGWTTLSILISIFGGFQLFFLGVMGEYIGAIFDEVKGRPLYLVEEEINFNKP
ncbi:MAG: putative glycosyltransferase [Chlamydiae bacterium]|nr:putative glycosyltransferase [Chlamydiota bacterium]